jgi:type I restriction enzyme S subunit
MSRYKAYPEYKDSGVEWIGAIPKDWDMWKISHACPYVASGTTPKSDDDVYYGGDTLWVTTGELREGLILDTQKKVSKKALVDLPTLRVHPAGSVAIAMYGATIGRLGIFGVQSTTNQACCVMPPSTILQNKYLFYWLFTTRQEIINLSSGGGQPNVNQEKIASLRVSAPTFEEQQKIANFLDHETAKIDTLIAKQQELIKLLKEKRQAVISHAVTKGLNPNAPMRDSGVEWLGEVPAHWKVKCAKNIATITRGAILRPVDAPEYFDENGEWAYLNISDATKCDKFLYDSKLRLSALGSTKSARVEPDNVIITASATIGKAFINKIKVCVHDGFIPFCNLKIDRDYLYHYLSNPFLYAAMGKSNTQKNIYLDEVKNMLVTVPASDEQPEIVSYIEARSFDFDRLVSQAEVAIELMQERRTALISAAVTGKIDVRDWQPPELEAQQVA